MKSLLGGSAALTVALLASSLLFNARPLVAEPSAVPQTQESQQQNAPVLVASSSAPEDLSAPDVSDSDSLENSSATLNEMIVAPPSVSKSGLRTGEMLGKASASVLAQSYVATAYSLGGRTASGLPVGKGIIAADRTVIPLGSRVRIEAGSYSGEYLVADTGGGVRGRRIDVWVPSTREACRFGRRSVRLTVLSYGGKRGATSRHSHR